MPIVTFGETAYGAAVATCELCEAAPLTPWHHDDEVCWVADCESCDLPMVVWKTHGIDPPAAVLDHLLGALAAVADRELGTDGWRLDAVRRQIPDHFHAHARRSRAW